MLNIKMKHNLQYIVFMYYLITDLYFIISINLDLIFKYKLLWFIIIFAYLLTALYTVYMSLQYIYYIEFIINVNVLVQIN